MKGLRVFVSLALFGAALFAGGCGDDHATPASPANHSEGLPNDNGLPSAPASISVGKVDNNGFSISWTPCTDGDVIGYKVYLYDPSPLREDSYRVVEEDLIVTSNQYVYNGEFCGLCWVRVSTVNGGLLESPLSPPAVVERNVPPQPSIQDPTVDASPSVPQPGPGSGPSPYEMYPTK